MKKRLYRSLIGISILVSPLSILNAGFGDAVVGGVVGGVVSSVISHGMYSSHHHYRGSHHRRHHSVKKVETDEMKIQKALKSLGFYRGPIDGQINSFESRNAIKALNRAYSIGDTAYMSPQERDALVYLGTLLTFDRYLIAEGTDRRTKTKRLQTALKVLGFYHGKIDGARGPKMRRAISEYKMSNGLGSGSKLGYEGEYRLVSTAKKANDKNIEDTINSLKRLGNQNRYQQQNPVAAQPQAVTPTQQPVNRAVVPPSNTNTVQPQNQQPMPTQQPIPQQPINQAVATPTNTQ